MQYSTQEFQDTITFIDCYRQMEQYRNAMNKSIIKSVVPAHQFEHLFNSWKGRKNDFGSFFLNLSYANQGAFIDYFGITIPGYKEYLKEIEVHPAAYICTVPPMFISQMHQLVLFFHNHAISKNAVAGIEIGSLPKDKFGNSKNWGKYILSLPELEQLHILKQIAKNSTSEIARKAAEYKMMKKETNLTPREV